MAMDLNSISIIGRLTRDPEIKYTTEGKAILSAGIAVNHYKKDDSSFFEWKMFGKPAESVKQYLSKGKQIAIEGYLKQERWEKDGEKFSRVVIIVENLELLGGNRQEQSNDYGYGE